MSYNPIPPRVWSRVQNPCTYTDASGNSDINYNQVYIPLTKQTVTQARANYEDKMIYKGNVLQYKGNSSRLTKSQKYTQLAKGFGPNRTKVFATQSQTYTNPNTTGLRRINTQTYPYPNGVVGEPNNPSGPFQYNVPNPNGCSNNSIQDGGTLVCGTFANPCTGDIIKQGATSSIIYNPASASDVPGSSVLFWDTQVQTWFPKPRYVMNNSTDKWPVNYKGLDGKSGLVSAVRPSKPYLMLIGSTCNSVTLSWIDSSNNCIPISSYNIYQNEILVQTVPYTTTSTIINGIITCSDFFYITSVSNTIESLPSNVVESFCPPTNISGIEGDTSCQISWNPPPNSNIIISSYNGQVNGGPIQSNITSPHVFSGLINGTTYTFNIYAVAIINGTTSISCPATITLTPKSYYTSSISGTPGTSDGYKYVYFSYPSSNATIRFNLTSSYVSSVGVVCVGGGGGGSSSTSDDGILLSGGGGGGAGCGVIQLNPPTINLSYTFNVASGGTGGAAPAPFSEPANSGTSGGVSNLASPSSTILINCTGGGGANEYGGSTGQQTVPSNANYGGNGGTGNGDDSSTILSQLTIPPLLLPFSPSYGGGGAGGAGGATGGGSGSYGTKGTVSSSSNINGKSATAPGSGGGGGTGLFSITENGSGGNGASGLIGFWWQPLF
jgi:hypothetical protein